ncbi:MAG: hypothetical protein WDW38_009156 [Sanguina aurantia]
MALLACVDTDGFVWRHKQQQSSVVAAAAVAPSPASAVDMQGGIGGKNQCLLPLQLTGNLRNGFTRAVEMKQVAEQDAERAKFVVMKAEQERNAAVIRAEGESESAKLISEATKTYGAGMLELRRIEAAKDIAEVLSKSRNVIYMPNTGNMLMQMPSN